MTTSRTIRWIVTLLVVALVGGFTYRSLQRGISSLLASPLPIDVGWLLLAGVIYSVGLLPMALYWRSVLARFAQVTSLGTTLWAYYLGHLGKYVPGKALVIALRAAAVDRPDGNRRAVVVSVFLETLTYMATGAVLAAAVMPWVAEVAPSYRWSAVVLAIVAGLPCLPPVTRRLARLVAGSRDSDDWPAAISWSLALRGTLSAMVSWLVLSLSLWATYRSVGSSHDSPFTAATTWIESATLPMVAGFLLLVPGGLGVRDAMVVGLLSPQMPAAEAVATASLWRLVTLLAEVATCGILYLSRLRSARPSAGQPLP